jgi:hypothetical protein
LQAGDAGGGVIQLLRDYFGGEWVMEIAGEGLMSWFRDSLHHRVDRSETALRTNIDFAPSFGFFLASRVIRFACRKRAAGLLATSA